ncbi:MAG: hypothetical protein LBU53_04860, partial [Zoogloeaceae bacterium]|nr:hypothetical protein [Zoogloeaceae bacterium]
MMSFPPFGFPPARECGRAVSPKPPQSTNGAFGERALPNLSGIFFTYDVISARAGIWVVFFRRDVQFDDLRGNDYAFTMRQRHCTMAGGN